MNDMQVHDTRRCELGEGTFWHPERGQLFWFDITGKRLLSVRDGAPLEWPMEEMTSAAGWIDAETLFLVGESGFYRFDIATGRRERIADLERDNPVTRSNDGRADPFGGYWIGTMGKKAETEAGAIYRYYRGEVRLLRGKVGIPNAMCFSPDGTLAYFADTETCKVMRQRLDPAQGWPVGEAEVYLDLSAEGIYPDGAVVDAEGHFWNAQWGAGRVAEYDQDGEFLRAFSLAASNSTCPCFGGADLATLFCTSAMQGISAERRATEPAHGLTYAISPDPAAKGQAEHRVILG